MKRFGTRSNGWLRNVSDLPGNREKKTDSWQKSAISCCQRMCWGRKQAVFDRLLTGREEELCCWGVVSSRAMAWGGAKNECAEHWMSRWKRSHGKRRSGSGLGNSCTQAEGRKTKKRDASRDSVKKKKRGVKGKKHPKNGKENQWGSWVGAGSRVTNQVTAQGGKGRRE